MTESVLIAIVVSMPLVYTAALLYFMWSVLKQVEEIKWAILKIQLDKAGLEDVIETTGHDLDYVSHQVSDAQSKLTALEMRVHNFGDNIRILTGAIQAIDERWQ